MTTRRPKKPPWRPIFLAYLKVSGNVAASADQAGISRAQAYRTRNKSAKFAQEWDEALAEAVDALELEARRRAVSGVDEPVYYQGQVVGQVRKYSDTLLLALLKAHRPERYRERYEHTGADGGPVKVESTVHHPPADVLEEILAVRAETGDVEEGGE